MRKAKYLSFGMLVSVASMTALLSAPVALADDGHHDGDRGRGGDEHRVVTVVIGTTQMVVEDADAPLGYE